MRTWGIAALALGCALLSGCSDGVPAPKPLSSPSPTATVVAEASAAPSQQVIALVPVAATILTVTDFAQVRDQLGDDGHDQAALWQRADAGAPLLTRGMFRDGGSLGSPAGSRIDQADVLWEAHFTGGADGYVVRFRDDVDLSVLEPARGELHAADHLLVDGVATDVAASWASAPGLSQLVPDAAQATYLHRGCLDGDTDAGLDPLDAYSISFGSTVATARLGAGRHDLFTRMRLARAVPAFAAGFADGAADPSTGRIGYRLVDPAKAADLALRGRLPFAVCAP